MGKKLSSYSFEYLLESILKDEISISVNKLNKSEQYPIKKYLTIKEVSSLTGIGSSVIRQLTLSRAMPHRKVKSRIILDENEIIETIESYKKFGWTDPDKNWDVKTVQSEIDNFQKTKEEPTMIDEILRKIIREELASFSNEIKNYAKKDKESYYGRTVLTIKEAANHFRTSPSTIYSLIKEDGMPHFKIYSRHYIVLEEAEAFLWRETARSYAVEGNIYWQRILQRLDWEEKERNVAYEKALKRLEDSTF
ncbi:helix-turn-helix domain-containing protein [Heyndrickxia sporothermodurans]|nr:MULTISPECIES: helix-turn-helix domain-containing protein [Bacillaceae]MED3653979.1 helix-turn-helix domain-containing protein [Heyndrickxia sporothermodurans]WNS75661.1 helix-turn-helix domain-containing protein [Bacillus sp. DTU_2020_1000418_1_SI_GHA_SEK_038]